MTPNLEYKYIAGSMRNLNDPVFNGLKPVWVTLNYIASHETCGWKLVFTCPAHYQGAPNLKDALIGGYGEKNVHHHISKGEPEDIHLFFIKEKSPKDNSVDNKIQEVRTQISTK